MKSTWPVLILIAATTVANAKIIRLADTPAAVQKTIQAQIGDGKLGDIDQTIDEGETIYEAGLTGKDGADRDFTVAGDGTLLSVEVPESELPAPLRQAIHGLVGEATLDAVDKNLDDEDVTYDLQLIRDSRGITMTIDEDGNVLSVEKILAETPEPVQKQINAQLGSGKLDSIYENLDGRTNFDVEITVRGGRQKGFTVDPDGTLVSEEFKLGELSASAQKTVKEQLGDGKIVRIDKSFTRKDGVLPYDVEATKDGKPFNFSVGPRGKFLGMDQ